jgi:hypothetical protein
VDQQFHESIRGASRFNQRRLNKADENPARDRRQLRRRGGVRRGKRENRLVGMIECPVCVAAEREMADRMRVRVLMDDDFAMSVFFDRMGVLGRRNGPKPQGGHESRQQGAARGHARMVSHQALFKKKASQYLNHPTARSHLKTL